MSNDIIRFADQQGFKTFTLMGHSMGGRCVMTTACLNPERVDGVISVDAAPWHWNKLACYLTIPPFRYLRFMRKMSKRNMTRKEAMAYVKKKYRRTPGNAAMFIKLMDRKHDKLVWTINVDAILNTRPTSFDSKLKYRKETAYFIRGKRSINFYRSWVYRRVFTKLNKKNIVHIDGAGHFVK